MAIASIKAVDLAGLAPDSCRILDVRTAPEHAEKHLKRPHDLVPLDRLDPVSYAAARGIGQDDPLYILCKAGPRAGKAAQMFADAGFTNIHVVDGGIMACESCNEPLASGSDAGAVMSLERQVRIAAGALVVAGILGGFFISPVLYLLALFVGAGLVFAGLTDWCGMALLLAKAPWNRQKSG